MMISAKSAKCHTGLSSSGSNLIIDAHCSGKSASLIGEFIDNLQFLSINSDGLSLYGFPCAGWCTTCTSVFVVQIVRSYM